MTTIEKAKTWMERNPPTERIVDRKIMQSYCHEYPIIRDLLVEVERLTRQISISAWNACSDGLPDSDMTVMTYSPDSDEPIWPAYHDGERWFDPTGNEIDDALITHWMMFPEPPEKGSV